MSKTFTPYPLLCLVMLLSTMVCFGQAPLISITGKVNDNQAMALPGVAIRVKGSNGIGASTDTKGNFTIKVKNTDDILVFSYIGYQTAEIKIGGQTTLNVVLQESRKNLDEVIVIGYGQINKADLTGSVGSVKMSDFEKAPVRSFEEALAGRVSGVQVSSPEGQPGAGSDIVIRGNSSVTQDNSPLYVIDGFPMETPNNNVLNPSEIESINVLKDASATAIYGARGANGVIIISTKKGKTGKPIVSYDGYFGFQQVIKTAKLMNPIEFVKYQLELDPLGAAMSYTPPGGKTLADYQNIKGIDWQQQVFRTAGMQNQNFAVRGGTDQSKYSISGSALGQQGIVINSGFDRYQGRIALDQTLSKSFKIGLNTNYTSTKITGTTPSTYNGTSNSLSLLYSVWGYRPVSSGSTALEDLIDLPLDPDVDGTSDYRYNPILSAKNEINNNFEHTLIANGYAELKILPELNLRISGGMTQQTRRMEVFYNSKTKYGDLNSAQGSRGASGRLYSYERNNYLNENILSYRKTFNKTHNLTAMAGFTVQKETNLNFGYQASGLPNEGLGLSGLDEGTPLNTLSVYTNNFLESFLTRINYSYRSRYLLTASMRADGSSKFASGNKWGYFPSGAFAWRLSEEPFFKKNITVISNAKLRTSIGLTGNNRISDFGALPTTTFPISKYYTFENAYYPGAIPTTMGNTNLKWETTLQIDAGLDLSFFKGRIELTVDYYNKHTYDLLLNSLVPSSSGYETALVNIGKVSNRGWEFELSTNNITGKPFHWNTSFNIAFNKNKVLELARQQESITQNIGWETGYNNIPPYVAQLGQPIGQFFGLKWTGNYQFADFIQQADGKYILKNEVPDNGSGRDKVQPGDIKYADLNGDGTVNALDRMVIGDPNPDFMGGLSNNFSFKQFDLNVFLQWSYGNDVLNANRLVFEGSPRLSLNQFATYADRWTSENQNNTMFRTKGYGPTAYSSRVIEDASYLRLKTVSLGYNFKPEWAKALKVSTLKIYASAQNLLTWTNYSGLDPEVSTKNSALTRGFDFAAYPRAKTMVFGLNASL